MTSNVRFVSHTRIVVTTLLDGLNKVSKYVCTNIGIHYDRAGDTRDFDYDPELLLMYQRRVLCRSAGLPLTCAYVGLRVRT